MLNILLSILFFLIFSQHDRNRTTVVAVFALEKIFCQLYFVISDILFVRPVGGYYYLPMALMDFLTIFILSNLSFVNNLIVDLQRICLVSICANLIAWTCWQLYIDHAIVYNAFYIFMYVFAIYLIIRKDIKNDGDRRIDLWARHLRLNTN